MTTTMSDLAELLTLEHPDYRRLASMWQRYSDLYSGGEQIKVRASEYLLRRQKEPLDIYGERLSQVFYENYIGSIIDWYGATLFRREPTILLSGHDEKAKAFFAQFIDDCDLRGTNLPDFFRLRFIESLVYGRTYIALDFPFNTLPAHTRAEEDALGKSRAYIVGYTPLQLVNWGRDALGNLEWALIRLQAHTSLSTRSGPTASSLWLHYDRTHFRLFTRQDGKPPVVLREGLHSLAAHQRVPLFEMAVTDGLWLMNKAALLQLEHFNKSNALAWALTMGLFAMPVVYSEKQWKEVLGESYFIQLGKDDRFGWAEPEGKVYQIAADNLMRLKDEIYRVCYLMSHAVDPSSAVRQSGLSKQRDYVVTQEVLRAYGDMVKDCMKRLLAAVALAREDHLSIEVSGLDQFDIAEFSTELDDACRLLELNIPSPTLRKHIFKKLAFKYLSDLRQDLKDQIAREIDLSHSEE